MYFSNLVTISLLVCLFIVKASSLPRQVAYASEAYIDCNDLRLVRRMEDVAIPYSCIRGTGNPFVMTVEEEALPTAFVPIGGQKVSVGGDGSDVTLILDESLSPHDSSGGRGNVVNIRKNFDIRECLDPERCGANNYQSASPHTQLESIYLDSVVKCPQGYVFVAEIGQCLSVEMSYPTVPQRDQYFIPNSEILRIRECKEGYYFDLNKGKCLNNKNVASSNQKNNEHYVIQNHVQRCKQGYTFVSEIGICLPVPQNIVSMPQNTEPAKVSLKFTDTNCPVGSIYNPEVDLCLSVVPPIPHQEKPKRPQAMSQVTQSDHPAVDKVSQSDKTHKCKPGTVYNSEIDLCSPIDVEIPQGDEPAPLFSNKKSSIKPSTPDPFKPVLLPLTAESIGASKCKSNEVYVSEIDFCIEV